MAGHPGCVGERHDPTRHAIHVRKRAPQSGARKHPALVSFKLDGMEAGVAGWML
jgi:hypothetical protein